MNPAKEQLESQWWHRLVKVLRWILAVGVFISFIWISLDEYGHCNRNKWIDCNENLLIELLIAVGLALTTYFLFWLIYKKVILYIIFGKKNKL